jgi:hypothetical protein
LVINVLAHIMITKKFTKRNVACKVKTEDKRKLTKQKYTNESIEIFKDQVYLMLKFNREIKNEQSAKLNSVFLF